MFQNDLLRLPPFHFDADPDLDPAFDFYADLDPASQNDADPDPQHWCKLTLKFIVLISLMRSSLVRMRSSLVRMRSSLERMRSSLVADEI